MKNLITIFFTSLNAALCLHWSDLYFHTNGVGCLIWVSAFVVNFSGVLCGLVSLLKNK